jgi:two-component system sensor kinase FixL
MLRRSTLIVLWAFAVLAFSGGATAWRWSAMVADNERAGAIAHRILSQRADQHDAHMTNLAALAMTTTPPPGEALLLVAASILQFYPRIVAIDLVPLAEHAGGLVISSRKAPAEDINRLIRDAARQGSPKPALVRTPAGPDRYLLVKRVPNSAAAAYALSLEIDATRLADLDGASLPVGEVDLLMPDGGDLGQPALTVDLARTPWPAFTTFEKALGSASQPLILRLRREASMASVVPWSWIGLFAVAAGLTLLGWRTYAAARLAAREARSHAAFREQEVRLAHASRVNAMGELSLGIAHELTQPLAAILSQSQAGLRMIEATPLDRAAVVGVLEANVRHARRAGDILARLRDWVSARPGRTTTVDVNEVITGVIALTRADFDARGIATRLSLASPPPLVSADHVELEQVAYNLATNAADACAAADRPAVVTITTFLRDGRAGFEVRDSGDGLKPEALPRVFEPFYTSKDNGMGLGLALCQRLVERLGGEIKAANDPARGALFTVTLPSARTQIASQRQAAE